MPRLQCPPTAEQCFCMEVSMFFQQNHWVVMLRASHICQTVEPYQLLLSYPQSSFIFFLIFFFSFIFISWRLITSQHCSGFCHTLTWISHGVTSIPHPDPPSHLPLHPLPLGFPSAPGPSACLMHPTWAGDLFHPRYYTWFDAVLLKHPTLSFSHRV